MFSLVFEYREALLNGFTLTLEITALAALGAFILGTLLACLRQLPLFFVQQAINTYVEVIRNVPSVVKVFFFYFVAGWTGWTSAVVGLAVHQSAYICDSVDAGFRAIPDEQAEAAWALGHSRLDIFRTILLPQVWPVAMPALTNQFIEVLKNSSIAMLISVEELTFQTQQIDLDTFRGFEAATVVTGIYVALALTIAGFAMLVERRLTRQ